MSSISDVRRAAADKAFDRVRAANLQIEPDPRFHQWIEAWIAGEMTMDDVRRLYRSLVEERRDLKLLHTVARPADSRLAEATPENYQAMSLEALLGEALRLTGDDQDSLQIAEIDAGEGGIRG